MEPLFVCFTMDVERIHALSPGGGPQTWEQAEAAIESYAKALNSQGFPVTFFVVPNAMEKLRNQLTTLLTEKNEIGLHFHLDSWNDFYLDPKAHPPLGAYDYRYQMEVLKRAKDQFEEALGFTPKSFRGGYFSANNFTFKVLTQLGFQSGSVSIPGRSIRKFFAHWIGTRRDVHKANETNRLIEGSLDFIEVPFSVQLNAFNRIAAKGDIRMEKIESKKQVLGALQQTLEWQIKNHSKLKHFCLFTHDIFMFTEESTRINPDCPSKVSQLQIALESIHQVALKYDLSIQGCTLSKIAEIYTQKEGITRKKLK